MSRNDVPLIENNLDFLPFVPDAVILADGEYPVHEYPLRLLRETPYIVCCDGAANTFISHGYIPNMIIGDGDSLSVENRMLYKDRLLYVADQETNDLTKAIRFLLGKNFRNVVILGATGKRPYVGEYQLTHGAFSLFFTLGYGDRLWSIYTGMRQSYIRFSSRTTSFCFQFRCM